MSTIHVANLSPAIHGDMLRSIFAHFGPIADIRLISGQGPASYAFVEFSTSDAAVKALAMSGSEFDGRALRVELANQKGGGGAVPPANPQALSAELFVGGLAPSITGDMLRMHFSRWGAVQEANVMTHRQTGVSKGFGFVRLQSHDQALACVGGAPHIIEGRTLNVELSNLGKNAAGMPPAPAPRKRKHSVDTGEGDGRGLCVQQLFDAAPALEAYAQKVEADTHATCGAFGSIRSIGVPRPKVSGLAVWVEFDESRAARAAAASLASRTYDGRTLGVRVVDSGAARRGAAEAAAPSDGDTERLREKARFEADQSRLLQRRVEDLESELESVRASAKKDRDFQKQRIAALVARVAALESV
jgi:hypothetical protein